MGNLVLNGVSFYTARDTQKTVWRGGIQTPFATGRSFQITVVCLDITEVDDLSAICAMGPIAITFPDGTTATGVVNRDTYDPLADIFAIDITVEEQI